MFVCVVSYFPRQLLGYIADGPQNRASDNFTHETELGDHDFCLSRSHYTDTYKQTGSHNKVEGTSELGDHDFCLSRSHYTDTDKQTGSHNKVEGTSQRERERQRGREREREREEREREREREREK